MKYFQEHFLLAFNVVINGIRYPIYNYYRSGEPLVTPFEMLKSVLSRNDKEFPCFANLTESGLLLEFNNDAEIPQNIQALIDNVTYKKVKNDNNTIIIENMHNDELKKVFIPSRVYDNHTSNPFSTKIADYLTVNKVMIGSQGEIETYIFDVVALLNHLISKTNVTDSLITDKYELPNYDSRQETITFVTKYSVIPVREEQNV